VAHGGADFGADFGLLYGYTEGAEPRMNFAFWNLNRKPLIEHVVRLAELHSIDVLLLAESPYGAGDLLSALNRAEAVFYFISGASDKLQFVTRIPPVNIKLHIGGPRFMIREIPTPGSLPLLIVAAHLPGKMDSDDKSQASECIELARDIREAESKVGHERTILVGDLNVDPFSHGVVASNGFNGVMSRQIADSDGRTVQGRRFPFFYNPMWSLYGDHSRGPCGSYFYNSSNHLSYYWHMIDQVLVRPALVPAFPVDRLQILDRIGSTELLTGAGRPDRNIGSDHLPLLFTLNDETIGVR
jgi:hypothetical protein